MAKKSIPAKRVSNPALEGFTIDQRHPLSGYTATSAEDIAEIGIELTQKLSSLVMAIKRLSQDATIAGLADNAHSIIDEFANIFDCERECHHDAAQIAKAA